MESERKPLTTPFLRVEFRKPLLTPPLLENFGAYRCVVCDRVFNGEHRPMELSAGQKISKYAQCPSCYCGTHGIYVQEIRTELDARRLFGIGKSEFEQHLLWSAFTAEQIIEGAVRTGSFSDDELHDSRGEDNDPGEEDDFTPPEDSF